MSALPLELVEHETYIAEVQALRELRTIAALVLMLHDGERDDYFDSAWPAAMTILRHRLEKLEQIRPRT